MVLEQFALNGRVALVTGASRGLGLALAVGLVEAGADIACISRSGNDQQVRQRVEALGRRFLGLPGQPRRPGRASGAGRSGGRGLGADRQFSTTTSSWPH